MALNSGNNSFVAMWFGQGSVEQLICAPDGISEGGSEDQRVGVK